MNLTLEKYIKRQGFLIPENWERYRIYFNNPTSQLKFAIFSESMKGTPIQEVAEKFHRSTERVRVITISMAQKISEHSRDNHYIGIQ